MVQSLDNCIESFVGADVLSQFVQILNGPSAAIDHALYLTQVIQTVLGHASF
jgi:hypothetical protein